MQISVNTNNVILKKVNTIESGEYNVTPCNFTFTEEYDGLIKTAVFTKNGISYKMNIINNLCQIPYEVLEKTGVVALGVFAYEEQDSNLILRYSPRPTVFNVTQGSYKENAENSTPPTPTQFEQYEEALEAGLTEVQNVDIDANKLGTTATVTVTNRNGETKTVEIHDGANGQDGQPGPQGAPGKDGKDGIDGKDGQQGPQGVPGKDGVNGINGKDGVDGKNGQDGYTPVRGTDYWTAQDIAAIEQYCDDYIDEHIAQAIGGAY